MATLKDLKKNKKNKIKEIRSKMKEQEGPSFDDDRYWKLEVDKSGNGSAIIRFLDTPKIDAEKDGAMPWVRYWNHGFQSKPRNGSKPHPGLPWYIENCPTTLGRNCPVCEENSKLWNTNENAKQNIARDRKRGLHYVSNILVIKDPKNPDNEGKVFLYEYGKKIYDKIQEKAFPDESFDEEPVDVFDFWEGANFKLKAKNVHGYRNYDSSEWDSCSAVGNDDEIQEIWEKEYSILEIVDEKNFKPYEELKKRFARVMNAGAGNVVESVEEVEPDEVEDDDTDGLPDFSEEDDDDTSDDVEEEDDNIEDDEVSEGLEYYQQLAGEDEE